MISKYQKRKFPDSSVHQALKKSMVLLVLSFARGAEIAPSWSSSLLHPTCPQTVTRALQNMNQGKPTTHHSSVKGKRPVIMMRLSPGSSAVAQAVVRCVSNVHAWTAAFTLGMLLVDLPVDGLLAVAGQNARKDNTWLGCNAEGIIAVRWSLNVPNFSTRASAKNPFLLLLLLPLPLAETRPCTMVFPGQM